MTRPSDADQRLRCAYSTRGFADTLVGHLARLVHEKCWAKVFTRLGFPVVLLLDAFFNDLHEDYAWHSEAEWVAGYRREFAGVTYPLKVTIVVKRYERSSLGQSAVLAFLRTEEDRDVFQRFLPLFSLGRLRILG